jgi:hypothetical protein
MNVSFNINRLIYRLLRITFFLVTASTAQYCEKELSIELPQPESKIVVEGWIEHEGYPNVILTRSAPYFSSIDSGSLRNYVVTKAKVTVISGDQHEVLTLKPNDAYFPPYVYFGTELKGKVQGRYYLKVEFEDSENNVYASTSIP